MTQGKGIANYIGAFVDELVRCGVNQAVISPGSRSTPLALLMAEHPGMKVWMHIDERSAAFFALGMAKAQRKPVALVCSSGTAVANYLPAVVEAAQARVPLLALTADRPPELRAVGAPQTIDQIGIFGHFVKLFVEMSVPDDSPELLQYARSVAARASAMALAGPSGPVHLNFPLREPLLPDLSIDGMFRESGRGGQDCYTRILTGPRYLEPEAGKSLAKQLQGMEKGLIICGPHDDPALASAVVSLAERLQYPVLADPLSQVRSGAHDKRWIVETYDSFLRDPDVVDRLTPEVVIRFGAMPVSKALLFYLKGLPLCRQIVVDEELGWRDPTLMATDMIYAGVVPFCRELNHWLDSLAAGSPQESSWAQKWLAVNELTRKELYNQGKSEALFEGRVFIELGETLPAAATLFVGNSMPVRDLDTFFFCNDRNIRILANRGANGIDGVVSTALGVAASDNPLVLVIGDLSFYHDLNGLLAAKLHGLNATVIVINNDGGGIFSFLPQARLPQHFEKLFGTPLGLDFKAVAEMYHGEFSRVRSWEEFRQTLQHCLAAKGLKIIEIPTNRADNVQRHREIWQAVSHIASRSFSAS
ncbi:menaquinone biosynthesis protein mend [Lucifera butyrica]|uniref:2-succinyl-5-enolpyruvyl-6-hydroxy-3-cyclohexene-1-carboxylate synthase n=1 Tax=Lucifera butyrica TaxID=1351585 RepID=A0A498R0Q7_9FIRM|nr:2-succinyl-5-enolpyruvyl-6-hydroxy-3-cyclohexene-1-carboxylic-acid synthase [Lucifera butyrica]VBB06116.1 menaquinone biosynthesis protein mend [Lucifera butyrica]